MPYLLFTSYQISLPLQMAERLLRAQPDSVANHIKARQLLMEWSELAEILLIYVLCVKFSDILAYYLCMNMLIEIRRAVPPFAVEALFSGSAAPVLHIISQKCWYSIQTKSWWWAIRKICVYLISRFYSNLMLVKYTCFTVLSYSFSWCLADELESTTWWAFKVYTYLSLFAILEWV